MNTSSDCVPSNLRQQPDAWGRSFTFVVNGLPIFAKGSNWIPADTFPTRITDACLEGLIRSAVQTHQNMLRVWGGGFYEEERFYDLCDRYGILVWQEFIFSCSVYPLDDAEFLENVHVEVTENIRRLRHRASLALWCGNNEMEWGWVDWGWKGAEYQRSKLPTTNSSITPCPNGAPLKTLSMPTGPARLPPIRPSRIQMVSSRAMPIIGMSGTVENHSPPTAISIHVS